MSAFLFIQSISMYTCVRYGGREVQLRSAFRCLHFALRGLSSCFRSPHFALRRHLCFAFLVRGSRFAVWQFVFLQTALRRHLCFAFAVRTSHFAVRTSRFALRGSHFAVRTSQFALRSSHFAVRGSHFAVRTSRFALRGSHFAVRSSHLVRQFAFSQSSFVLPSGSRFASDLRMRTPARDHVISTRELAVARVQCQCAVCIFLLSL